MTAPAMAWRATALGIGYNTTRTTRLLLGMTWWHVPVCRMNHTASPSSSSRLSVYLKMYEMSNTLHPVLTNGNRAITLTSFVSRVDQVRYRRVRLLNVDELFENKRDRFQCPAVNLMWRSHCIHHHIADVKRPPGVVRNP